MRQLKINDLIEVVKFDEDDFGYTVLDIKGNIITIKNFSSGNVYKIIHSDIKKVHELDENGDIDL